MIQPVTLLLGASTALLPSASGALFSKTPREPDEVCTNAFWTALLTKASQTGLTNKVVNLAAATVVGFATTPIVDAAFNVTHIHQHTDNFHQTLSYSAAKSIAKGAQATALVLLIDLAQDALKFRLPFLPETVDLVKAAPAVGFTVWASLTVSIVKRILFHQRVTTGTGLGRAGLLDRLLDFGISLVSISNIFSILSIDVGTGLKSVFAASGVSAVVLSLACKGLIEQVVGGIMVRAWDAIEVGEYIRLQDGMEGTVTRIGLVDTEIIGGDNIVVWIPNSSIPGQRVSNISRTKRSRVKQLLRFKYSDLQKLSGVLAAIKAEIQRNCPKLIIDGSKPFRAVLTAYEPDHVRVEVDCHFEINPGSGEYVETRQQVLLSIANAVKENEIEFALPSMFYATSGDKRLID